MFFWASLVIFIVSLGGIVFLFIKRYLDVLILDAGTVKRPENEIRKEKILEERLRRFGRDRYISIARLLRKIISLLKPRFNLIRKRLQNLQHQLERARSHISETVLAKQEKTKLLLEEGRKSYEAGNWALAEGKYVDALRIDPRAKDVYKALAELYLTKRSYTEAEETLEFLAKLSPKDPGVYMALIRIAEEQGQHAKLLEYLAKIVELEPNNPRYLDLLIETSILLGNKRLGRQGLDKLRKVNPDNQKIGEFEQRISGLK